MPSFSGLFGRQTSVKIVPVRHVHQDGDVPSPSIPFSVTLDCIVVRVTMVSPASGVGLVLFGSGSTLSQCL